MRFNNLHTRVEALERVQVFRVPVYVRCRSDEGDSEDQKRAREQQARAAYIEQHGEPPGGVGVIHRSIVDPKRRDGGAHA